MAKGMQNVASIPWWERMITKEEFAQVLSVSTKTIDRKVDAGLYPAPAPMSERTPRWSGWEVREWLEARGKKENEDENGN